MVIAVRPDPDVTLPRLALTRLGDRRVNHLEDVDGPYS